MSLAPNYNMSGKVEEIKKLKPSVRVESEQPTYLVKELAHEALLSPGAKPLALPADSLISHV